MSTKKLNKSKSIEISQSNIKNDAEKKVVVKRRKVELKPTKASAVAIASQANRAKKQALIERMASWEMVQSKKSDKSSITQVPLWVWIFFGVSLLLFCVAFYQAIIRPQLEDKLDVSMMSNDYWDGESKGDFVTLENESSGTLNQVNTLGNEDMDSWIVTSEQLIKKFFVYLSERRFDDAFGLFWSKTQNDENIREHFTSFRMAPFFNWIEWWRLEPTNIHYIENVNWKDKYWFDISYVLSSNNERYEESWEVIVGEAWWEQKILNIVCVTHRCSYHPIFWPENFGLMR